MKNFENSKKNENLNSSNDFLSAEEASNYIKIQVPSLYKAVFKKKLKAAKMNNKIFFLRKDLDEYRLNKFNRDSRRSNGKLIHDLENGRYSVLHIAKILSEQFKCPVTIQHIYAQLWKGRLKGHRIGATWVVMKEDLQKFLQKKEELSLFKLKNSA